MPSSIIRFIPFSLIILGCLSAVFLGYFMLAAVLLFFVLVGVWVISQGAKPGHGGILPAAKISAEISRILAVPMEQDCISPLFHQTFDTPVGLFEFVQHLRELAQGKLVDFKLCIGQRWEFLAICKAMLETGIYPDFIVIDGNEGGTGAARPEFVDHVGTDGSSKSSICASQTSTGIRCFR